jgi:LPXTG-motif cell wall-anchored protein
VIVNGTPAATDVVIVTVPDAAVPADRRSPTEVQSVQRAAEQLVDEFLVAAPPGAEPLVSLLETDTGAVLIGVLVDPRTGATIPVPVENVVLVTAGNLRVLLAGADDMGRPAPVSNGVLEVTDGGVVSAVAYGLPPRASGEVVMFSTPRLLGTFTTDDDGSFAGQMTLPDGLDPGAHTLVLAAGGLTSSLGLLVKAQGDVASPTVPTPGPGQLPTTGEAPHTSLLLALVLISLGMVLATRRRSLGT